MTLIMHTITGVGHLPDASGVLVGTWWIELVSDTGYVIDHDQDGFRAGKQGFKTDSLGEVNIVLPATHQPDSLPMDYFYRAWFSSPHGDVKVGRQYFELLSDTTIDQLLVTPVVIPLTPPMVDEANAAAALAKVYRDQAEQFAHDAGSGGGGWSPIVFTQSSPAATWTITHPRNSKPAITLLLDDDLSEPVFTDVKYPDLATVVIEWPTPCTGKAYL